MAAKCLYEYIGIFGREKKRREKKELRKLKSLYLWISEYLLACTLINSVYTDRHATEYLNMLAALCRHALCRHSLFTARVHHIKDQCISRIFGSK